MACKKPEAEISVITTGQTIVPPSHPYGVGSVLPDIQFLHQGKAYTLHEYFSRRTGVIFAVPGAFTPTCSEAHFPSFIQHSNEILNYVDDLMCLSVNDRFVMQAWKRSYDAPNITFLADPQGATVKTLGVSQDLGAAGLEVRSQRFAIIVGQGCIKWIDFNERSFAEPVLAALRGMPRMKGLDVDACLTAAKDALMNAHAPYSKYSCCGAAIQTDKGIIKGCTFESCAYPNSICGVRAAVVAAVSEGALRFDGIVVSGNREEVPYVCGLCCEMLSQFGNIPVGLFGTGSNNNKMTNVSCLIPSKVWTGPSFPIAQRTIELTEAQVEGYKPDSTVQATPELLELYQRAIKACHKVYTPVSHFPVGAAVLTDKGIFSGSNIEHQVIGLGLCGERTTLCKAVAAGAKKVHHLAVVCFKMESYGSPCGGCRQSIVEFGDYPVHLLKMNHTSKTFSVKVTSGLGILPDGFLPAALG